MIRQRFTLEIETGHGVNPDKLKDDIYAQLAQYGYCEHTVGIEEHATTTKASEYQPHPRRGEKVVVDVILADIRERAEVGRQKYGHYLETNNGRNPLWDAYQEAIDLVMYLRQALLEEDFKARGIDE